MLGDDCVPVADGAAGDAAQAEAPQAALAAATSQELRGAARAHRPQERLGAGGRGAGGRAGHGLHAAGRLRDQAQRASTQILHSRRSVG
ncbi:unnamed protein product [Phytophthora lilii]|uniref:Unnamed protein product n=1 Tax=Phytophthora lilii TaxID=2077276 RepID=A0A9W6TEU8_9STRA|nr:unnamed protein product [Phytophthora lilii]